MCFCEKMYYYSQYPVPPDRSSTPGLSNGLHSGMDVARYYSGLLLPWREAFCMLRKRQKASVRIIPPDIQGNDIQQLWQAHFLKEYPPHFRHQFHTLANGVYCLSESRKFSRSYYYSLLWSPYQCFEWKAAPRPMSQLACFWTERNGLFWFFSNTSWRYTLWFTTDTTPGVSRNRMKKYFLTRGGFWPYR